MNLFLFEDDTVPLPPVITNHSSQRVLAVFDGLNRAGRPVPGFSVRAREDALVDAKAVDERVRTGENPPLAGMLVAAPESPLLCRRLSRAGAVVVGTTRGDAVPGPADVTDPRERGHTHRGGRVATLGGTDAVIVAGAPVGSRDDAVAFVPTRGLVPGAHPVTVLASDVDAGQRVAAALTGPDEADTRGRDWPDRTRLSAGDHPHVAVSGGRWADSLAPETRHGLGSTADSLRAAGSVVDEIDLAEAPPGAGVRGATESTAAVLAEHDALVLPWSHGDTGLAHLLTRLDTAAVALPDSGGVGVLGKAFDDQVVLDLAGALTGAQTAAPYPGIGLNVVVFGGYLRGQPRQEELTRVSARFADPVTTAPRYRMIALGQDPPDAGVVPAESVGGTHHGPLVPLTAERWLVSPSGLGELATHLRPPMRLGGVELADGRCVLGILCEPTAAEHGTDVTAWGCWRAYLRHRSTQRPSARPGTPV